MPVEDMYTGFTAQVYDHVVPYRARTDVAFYVNEARRAGGPVLELGCGTGRVLFPVARAGADITGLDTSATVLELCGQKVADEPAEVRERIRLTQGDMSDFDLGRKFGLITTPFRGFQHLMSVEDQLACLECVRNHLEDDGCFILDLFNPNLGILAREVTGEEEGDEPEFELPDGRKVLRRFRVLSRDLARQSMTAEFIYYITAPDGSRSHITEAFSMRWLFRYEAEHLLHRAGLSVEAVFGDFAETPFENGSPAELILRARKA